MDLVEDLLESARAELEAIGAPDLAAEVAAICAKVKSREEAAETTHVEE